MLAPALMPFPLLSINDEDSHDHDHGAAAARPDFKGSAKIDLGPYASFSGGLLKLPQVSLRGWQAEGGLGLLVHPQPGKRFFGGFRLSASYGRFEGEKYEFLSQVRQTTLMGEALVGLPLGDKEKFYLSLGARLGLALVSGDFLLAQGQRVLDLKSKPTLYTGGRLALDYRLGSFRLGASLLLQASHGFSPKTAQPADFLQVLGGLHLGFSRVLSP